jgi:hypothetical protein
VIALLAWLVQSAASAAPIVHEAPEMFSSTGQTKLVYRVAPHRENPIEFEVFRGEESLWKTRQPFEFELASVDDRGWAAGLRWMKSPFAVERKVDVAGKGMGELIVFDNRGAIAARRFVVEDKGWGCFSQGLEVLDLLSLDDGTLLLRTSENFGPRGGWSEGWQVFRSSDLERVSAASPGAVSGRPNTPLYLPLEWGSRGEPALEVKVVPGTGLLVVRWPFPEWRAVDGGDEADDEDGGVQPLQLFSVHLSNAEPVAEFALPALPPSKEIDPEFNLALPRYRAWSWPEWFRSDAPQRFSLRRGLDGAWIAVKVTSTDGAWSAKLDPR